MPKEGSHQLKGQQRNNIELLHLFEGHERGKASQADEGKEPALLAVFRG